MPFFIDRKPLVTEALLVRRAVIVIIALSLDIPKHRDDISGCMNSLRTAKNGNFLEDIFSIFYFLIFIFRGKIGIDWKNSEFDSEFFHIFEEWYKG